MIDFLSVARALVSLRVYKYLFVQVLPYNSNRYLTHIITHPYINDP